MTMIPEKKSNTATLFIFPTGCYCIIPFQVIYLFIRFLQPRLRQANKCKTMAQVTQVVLKISKVFWNTSYIDMAHGEWISDRLDDTIYIHFNIFSIEFTFIIINTVFCYLKNQSD